MGNVNRAIPELSLDTQTLERALIELPIGGVIDYVDLTMAIGRDVQTVGRGNLATARHRLLKSHRMVFECVKDVGVKRLDDAGKIATGERHLHSSRNHARRASQKTSAVDDFNALPNHLKVKHNTVLALAGALRHMTSAVTTKKIAESVGEEQHKRLGLKECLQAMKPSV